MALTTATTPSTTWSGAFSFLVLTYIHATGYCMHTNSAPALRD
ncbi:hypothetical protein SEA_LASTHOPE_99 [Mycobacterium phage LastHope]|uniref:Uncharacterized protein n=1 Tax=Mycobacterium phage LastHope TaxID=2015886 RepID=A0A222ZR95_9CAUD|nr:hypothetical protein I5G99_gp009 [Mycobacterium phage LastHope]ASR87266.1 hypothetical protein SEA_LASTHOPE_99 [Mycobacterium phage LastHope]